MSAKKRKLEINVDNELKARLEADIAGMDVAHWTTHVSSTRGRSVTVTLRPECPKLAVV